MSGGVYIKKGSVVYSSIESNYKSFADTDGYFFVFSLYTDVFCE